MRRAPPLKPGAAAADSCGNEVPAMRVFMRVSSPVSLQHPTDFSSVQNHNERAVFELVQDMAEQFPGLQDSPELLADVACVALNRLQPRYIRHEVDFMFYLSERERSRNFKLVHDAVEHAFGFVQARHAMRARG
jgi:uncharacterized protein (DUF2267 family)